MTDFDDIFGDGDLAIPTVRGSANLDVEDYEGYDGRSSILDDELQEDIPSTPGRHPGAAAAPDVDGTSDWELLEESDGPGTVQTDYGAHPWGPSASEGYRPYSQQRTDMELRALGDDQTPLKSARPMRDAMHLEPEVINAVAVEEPVSWDRQWHGQRNQEPSNASIDPLTIYDRSSYEVEGSSQDIIGSGIFDMEEGVTWRPRDGQFANQYAMPTYLAEEDELGVQQSAMWDSTAGEWRVTQPSASGVSLARRVSSYKPPPMQLRPEATGPRSHIEAFGRKAARIIVEESMVYGPENRSRFLNDAVVALGPQAAAQARAAADRLIELGYRQDVAFEDALAHLVMHATVRDLTDKRRGSRPSLLPRLDAMAARVSRRKPALKTAAAEHLAPLTSNGGELRRDLGALYHSPAGRGIGQVAEDTVDPSESPPVAPTGIFTTRNVLIAGGVGLGVYLLFRNRKAIAKNAKRLMRKVAP